MHNLPIAKPKIFAILSSLLVFLSWAACAHADELQFSQQQYNQQQPSQQQPSQQQYGADNEGPTIVAPGGLTGRERTQLRRQYTYEVRQKNLLQATPDTSSFGGAPAYPGEAEPAYKTEGERLHHYFGTAVDLHKQGRLEEASEILRYISDMDPGDEYVRAYLARVQRELKKQRSRWNRDVARDAATLKRLKIKGLLRDGIDYIDSEDFDSALVKFYDVLALDPGNRSASAYVNRIKAIYIKKIRADTAMQSWGEARSGGSNGALAEPPGAGVISPPGLIKKADTMLDEKAGYAEYGAEKLLSDAELKDRAFNKRADDLLEDAEFGTSAEVIIAAKRAEEARANQLTLGRGDALKLDVLNHPELSGEIAVQASGEVILPLTGDAVMASNLTINELGEKIRRTLDKYVQKPHVFLSIVRVKSQVFYLIDDVSCTPYPITKSNMTLRDALFMSDWGNDKALGRVIVMKPSALHPIVRKVNAYDMIYRGNLANNINIKSGDVIYIPLTVGAKVTKTIYDTLSPWSAVMAARNEFLGLKWNTADYKNYFRMPENYSQMSQSVTSGAGGYGGGWGGYGGGWGEGYYGGGYGSDYW